jgi:poly(hydroxyalkanoate) depolymerase family esterase
MLRLRTALPSILLCLAFAAQASAGQLQQKLFTAKSYPGSRDRQYQVFVPSSYTGQTQVPMVMVLHGCQQTELNMINETRFKDLAEQENFIVVYPFITSYDGFRNTNCWGFFLDQHIHQGAGEVEDLHQVALEVEAAFKIDANRRYVTGLSSGAGMSVALAVAWSEYFAAAGSVEGLPYAETSSSVGFVCANKGILKSVSSDVAAMQMEQNRPEDQRPIPIMAIHSRNDCVVNIAASENIRDAWLARYGVSGAAIESADCSAQGIACTQTRFGSAQGSLVETVFYDGKRGDIIGTGSHYWVGDNSGQFADPQGPSASGLQWTFFKAHPFATHSPPTVSIASAAASGTSMTVTGAAAPAAGSVVEVDVRLDGNFPQAQKTASGTTSWTVTFDNLPNNANYVPVAIAKDSDGATASITGNPVPVGAPPANAPPTVTIGNVSVSADCVTVTGTASDPAGQLTAVQVELGTRGLKAATLNQNAYKYQECSLPGGTYSTQAQAIDALGAKSAIVSGPSATVSDLQVVTANWQMHMSAGRLRAYTAPCSVGFGACDAGFPEIFLANQFNAFPMYRKANAMDWYLHPENVQ